MIPTHNSTETAGLGLYMLCGDKEPGAEIFSAATKKDQAKIIHEEATRMVKASPDLREELTVVKNNISIAETASKFEPLSSDDKTLDGLNVHCGLLDEVHAHPNRGVFDVIETATGSRRQPLIWCITTAGIVTQNSIALELEQYGEKVLKGIIEDDTFCPLVWDIDDDDLWTDEAIWIKANPNLGVSVKLDDLRAKCKKAKETPSHRIILSANTSMCGRTPALDGSQWSDGMHAKKSSRLRNYSARSVMPAWTYRQPRISRPFVLYSRGKWAASHPSVLLGTGRERGIAS